MLGLLCTDSGNAPFFSKGAFLLLGRVLFLGFMFTAIHGRRGGYSWAQELTKMCSLWVNIFGRDLRENQYA